jgi:integrase
MAVGKINGRWAVRGRKGYWPDEPNRTAEYFGTTNADRQLALNRDEELRKRKYNRKVVRTKTLFFGELAIRYLQHGQAYMRPATLSALGYRMDLLTDYFGATPAGDITPVLVDKFVTKRLESVSRTTVNSDLTYLKRVLNWGVEEGFLGINPIEKYKKPSRDDAVIRPPTPDEIAIIIVHAEEHIRRALLIAYYTGARPGEIELLGLRYSNVGWDSRTITIASASKGGPRYGTIPLHPHLEKLLKLWQEEDKKTANVRRAKGRKVADPDLIIHWRGNSVKRINKGFTAAKKAAGITRRLRPYDFRHASITAISLSGVVDAKTASEFSRHSRPDTMSKVYTHTNLTALRRAVVRVPEIDIQRYATTEK